MPAREEGEHVNGADISRRCDRAKKLAILEAGAREGPSRGRDGQDTKAATHLVRTR